MAGQVLKAAATSPEKVADMMKLTKRQIVITMQMVNAENLAHLVILNTSDRTVQ